MARVMKKQDVQSVYTSPRVDASTTGISANIEPILILVSVGVNAANSCKLVIPGYIQVSASKLDCWIETTDQSVTIQDVGYAVAYSSGIRKIRHIEKFLRVKGVVSPFEAARQSLPVSCVVVWGRKQNSRRAIQYAKRRVLPVLYIEDGWIRTCSANAHSRISYSLLVDDIGVYYDSSVPSSLESYLNLPDDQFDRDCGAGHLAYAAQCRQQMIENDITKYNYCAAPSDSDLNVDDRPLVLVLDQTRDDASVRLGGMNADSFTELLNRAVSENPDSRVVVRTHPDVVAGRRKGYLQDRAKTLGVEISAKADNPIPWMKKASVVYVGTSQLGYEALLCGCSVKVGGQPFYAGWGLTEDFQPVTRRVRERTLDQLFHATHVYHARYCCPVTGNTWGLRECLGHVILQQRYFGRNAGKRLVIGITPWKRRYIKQFLRSPHGQLRFSNKHEVAQDETAVRWSFSDSRVTTSSSRLNSDVEIAPACIRAEDGFIRSVGLGSDFAPPASLVFDDFGLYFDSGRPSALEKLLNDYQCTDIELTRASELRRRLCSANMTKYNVGNYSETCTLFNAVKGQKKILIVGQVEGDQSLLRGSHEIRSNTELVRIVRDRNPGAFVVYKPHPDVVCGNRKGNVENHTLKDCVDRVESESHFLDCLNQSHELHTMTSLSGFEALLREKPVFTYGMPFYAGWGLTTDFLSCERRKTPRTIDELVYLCLAVYPHYLDLPSGEFVTVEQLVEILRTRTIASKIQNVPGWLLKTANIAKALTYKI